MKKMIFGTVWPSPNIQVAAIFTPQGPEGNVVYIGKNSVYCGPLEKNSLEGKGTYADLEQYFVYYGGFHYSMKDGLGVLEQSTKASFEQAVAPDVSTEAKFTRYIEERKATLESKIKYWHEELERGLTIVNTGEELLGDMLGKKLKIIPELDCEAILKFCKNLNLDHIKSQSNCIYTYAGELKSDSREGIGISIYKNGDVYLGNYTKNKRTGFGIYYWNPINKTSPKVYVGYHNQNSFVRHAAVLYKNGDFYVGEIANSSLSGKGSFATSKYLYQGEFKQGKRHGLGRLTESSYSYEGDFAKDQLEGRGTQKWEVEGKPVIAQGEFRNNLKHDKHFSLTYDGSSINCEICEGFISGYGVLAEASGMKYEGQFLQNKLDGEVTVTYPDGATCKCKFVDGSRRGEGLITLPPEPGISRRDFHSVHFEADIATTVLFLCHGYENRGDI